MTDSQDHHLMHATISRSGEVDFPLWVKAVAAFLSMLMPVFIAAALWQGSQIFEISVRMARIEATIGDAAVNKQNAADAMAKATLLEQRVERNERDLDEIKKGNSIK